MQNRNRCQNLKEKEALDKEAIIDTSNTNWKQHKTESL